MLGCTYRFAFVMLVNKLDFSSINNQACTLLFFFNVMASGGLSSPIYITIHSPNNHLCASYEINTSPSKIQSTKIERVLLSDHMLYLQATMAGYQACTLYVCHDSLKQVNSMIPF